MTRGVKPAAPWARVCYGVDASATDQGMVRAERRGRRLSYKVVPFDRDVLSAAASHGAAIASGVPVGLGIASWVVAPLASETKARRVFATLLDIQLPFPLETCVYRFTEAMRVQSISLSPAVLAKGGGALAVESPPHSGVASLALAVRVSDIESHLDVLREVGVDPHVLDYEGIAVWTQSLDEHPAKQDGSIRAVVYMRGAEGLVVLGCGSTFWSAHRISTAEPLAIDRFLRAQIAQGTADSAPAPSVEWIWSGSGLGVGEVAASLRADVEQRWQGRSVRVKDPESFLARALATRALTSGALRTDLRQGLLSHAGAQSHTEGGRIRSAVILLVSGILLCAAAVWWDFTVEARSTSLERQFSERVDSIVGYHEPAKGETAILIAERSLSERFQTQKPLGDAFSPSLAVSLQNVLGVLQAQGVQIAHLQLESDRLQVKGTIPATLTDLVLCDAFEPLGYRVEVIRGDESVTDRHSFVLNANSEVSHE